jgi:catechol 2,3-dioxygenase-like lactoylglutathione lyase family enzyme
MGKNTAVESPFSKLIQVGVVVKDLDRTVERLLALGIGPFTPMHIPPDAEQWFRGKALDAKFKISGAKLGEVVLELIQPVEGESPHQEFLDSKGEGIQHIAFAVDDLDREVAKFTRQGVSVLLSANLPKARVAYLDVGTGGLVFELIQSKE